MPREPLSRRCRILIHLSLIATVVASAAGAAAQSEFARINGPEDQSIPIPQTTAAAGQKDALALQAILDFIKATKGGAWTGMQASGTLSVPNGSEQRQSSATLSLSSGDSFRLDISSADSSAGAQSIRVFGSFAEAQGANGFRHSLPAATAAGGLFTFAKLLSSQFPDSATGVVDKGQIILAGQNLHRITITQPRSALAHSSANRSFSIIDLYFDPVSHLLVKSAIWDQINSLDPEKYLQVTTFGNYQKSGTTLVPFSFSQTLNGEPLWTLQLTSAQSAISFPPTYFHF